MEQKRIYHIIDGREDKTACGKSWHDACGLWDVPPGEAHKWEICPRCLDAVGKTDASDPGNEVFPEGPWGN